MALIQGDQTRLEVVVPWFRSLLGISWLAFQLYIIWYPQAPLVQRPLHLILALVLFFLWNPLSSKRLGPGWRVLIDSLLTAATCAGGAYYLFSSTRLTERMEGIDPVGVVDICLGILLLTVLLEAVRRAVGWSLLTVLLLFLGYAFVGKWVPGWLSFSGFSLSEAVEILTMSLNGILGITTQTSLQFVFYFIVFGAVYSSIGGSQLFIDIGLRFSGKHQGGAAKAAVVSSSLMGSISGSAVANVAATGVFTIPLMRRAGYSREQSAAIEAISSTGGQLMPPIMGVAAFLLAEMLQIDYTTVALAGLIPALAFYTSIFVQVDLEARKTGVGTARSTATGTQPSILGRLYLLTPPVVLVMVLLSGYSATYAATVAAAACILIGLVQPRDRLDLRRLIDALSEGTRQASQVAIPISAIGIIIAVAIQSNLALKFSSQLIAGGEGSWLGSMLLIMVGCLIMGTGLPTVAAYIIGAILFVPALLEMKISEMQAHFFVMYYCVLSMVTPPVALASYTAAGIAGSQTMRTSLLACRLSFVSFLIPFAFVFDARLLGEGAFGWVAVAFLSLLVGSAAWAIALVGYLNRSLSLVERLFIAAGSVTLIFSPTATPLWSLALVFLALFALWISILRREGGEAE